MCTDIPYLPNTFGKGQFSTVVSQRFGMICSISQCSSFSWCNQNNKETFTLNSAFWFYSLRMPITKEIYIHHQRNLGCSQQHIDGMKEIIYDWPLLCSDVGPCGRELRRVTLRAGMSWKRRETTVPKRLFPASVSTTHITNTHHTTTLTLPQPVQHTHTHDITIPLTHNAAYKKKEKKNTGTHALTKLQTNVTKTFEWSQRKTINFSA